MARKKKGFLRVLPALLIFVAAVIFLFFAWQKADIGFPSIFSKISSVFGSRRKSASWSVLEEIRDIKELETASYTMRSVFPYDFVAERVVDWGFLQMQYDRSPSLFLEKTRPAWHSGDRVPDEWYGAEIYALCREAGIDPGRPDYRFIIVSSYVSAGIDFDSWLADLGEPDENGDVTGIRVSSTKDGTLELRFKALPVKIISFIVEDRDTTAEGFPDVALSPERWRNLVASLEPRLKEMALESGLLEAAEKQGAAFLSEIFTAAGYQHVIFN